ncbi:MAG: DUF4804 domain-containing protein, partial [Parachlamydia sp.]|nr:DUF4804 domain-containing protein [Parachlamydia sp.]
MLPSLSATSVRLTTAWVFQTTIKIATFVAIALAALISLKYLYDKIHLRPVKNNTFSLSQLGVNRITFDQLAANTMAFEARLPFPTQLNKIENLVAQGLADKLDIESQANATRPILHQKTVQLINDFLEIKRRDGTAIEQALYSEMTQEQFIDRLLIKRPLVFHLNTDKYLLQTAEQGSGGFEAIGKEGEALPLTLQNYLSYDEMQISALLGVSTPTYFINSGKRYNRGLLSQEDYQKTGVYVGLVGARFERENLMEWQHMIVTPNQNTPENGYGEEAPSAYQKMWANFYGYPLKTFEETRQDRSGRYL